MTVVWTVFCRSNQAVLAVFTSKEDAHKFADTIAGNPYVDGPFEVDEEASS